MGTRGRKSSKGLALVAVPTLRQRPDAPAELTPDQAATWREVVASRPVGWFDAASAPLLVAYCRSTSAQAVIAQALQELDPKTLATPDGAGDYRRLLAMLEVQAKLSVRLATSMRLTQHSWKSADAAATAAKTGPSVSKLWERTE
jgi:hypothetical protein